MSGCSDSMQCPKCEGTMYTYSDYKPTPYESGHCYDCGYYYTTTDGQMDLEEVNEMRADLELEPLTKLRG